MKKEYTKVTGYTQVIKNLRNKEEALWEEVRANGETPELRAATFKMSRKIESLTDRYNKVSKIKQHPKYTFNQIEEYIANFNEEVKQELLKEID